MGFFDLNIPYYESDRNVADKSSLKSRRLKLALKAMELGYSGIAYNRNLKGVLSESGRCSTHPFPLSSLLKLVPLSSALSAAVKFHRDLLGVAVSAPFRQYTRLTVIADSPSQVIALNAGNPILRSYDITAVRPLNQNVFDQACQTSEVDIIVIDFSERLPFRLKQPMVKAAIKRGVYFEISYSGLIGDAQTRRLLISNSKILVDWTRGKNLILSSAASSATELRGPQDASNLLSLLGLRMEHAKSAISKNCRTLIANALRKKQFYKEAVKVEEIPPHEQVNPDQFAFAEWLKWDPISSGEGDLLLDDMEKSFSLAKTATVKTIEFTSAMNGLPAHGLKIKDLLYDTEVVLKKPDTGNHLSDAMETVDVSVCGVPEEQNGLNPFHAKHSSQNEIHGDCYTLRTNDCESLPSSEHQIPSHGFKNEYSDSGCQESTVLSDSLPKELVSSIHLQEEGQTSLSDGNIKYQAPVFEDSETMPIDSGTSNIFPKFEETISSSSEKLNYLNGLEENVVVTETQLHDERSLISGGNVLPVGGLAHITTVKAECIPISENHASVELSSSDDSRLSTLQLEESNVENSSDVGMPAQESAAVHKVVNKVYSESEREPSLVSSDASLQHIYVEGEQYKEVANSSVTSGDILPTDGSNNLMTDLGEPVPENVIGDWKKIDYITRYRNPGKALAGGRRRKQNSPHQPFLFPFKHFLKPCHFKRKARKLKPLTAT